MTANSQEINLAQRKLALDALFEERKRQHMTLLDAEWQSGVSWDAVRSWVKGRREPTMGNLIAVAQTLGFEIILRKQGVVSTLPSALVKLPSARSRKKPDPNQFDFLQLF